MMSDIERQIGLLEFLERYPFQDGPIAPPVAAFMERLKPWPVEAPMISLSTISRPLNLPTEFLVLNHQTGALEKHVAEQQWLNPSYAAGRTVLSQWTRAEGRAVDSIQHGRPRATIVDDIDADFY